MFSSKATRIITVVGVLVALGTAWRMYRNHLSLQRRDEAFAQLARDEGRGRGEAVDPEVARIDKHTRCRMTGVCEEGDPRASCERSFFCERHGLCTPRGGECRVAYDDCPRSVSCRLHGKCSRKAGGEGCEALSARDCEKSDRCRNESLGCRFEQLSSPYESRCVGASDAECRRSQLCTKWGKCAASPDGLACAATQQADCAASETCKLFGACTFHLGNCEARTSQDCEASAACKALGVCALDLPSVEKMGACAPKQTEAARSVSASELRARLRAPGRSSSALELTAELGPPARIELPQGPSARLFEADCERDHEGDLDHRLCPVIHHYDSEAGKESVHLVYSRRGKLLSFTFDER